MNNKLLARAKIGTDPMVVTILKHDTIFLTEAVHGIWSYYSKAEDNIDEVVEVRLVHDMLNELDLIPDITVCIVTSEDNLITMGRIRDDIFTLGSDSMWFKQEHDDIIMKKFIEVEKVASELDDIEIIPRESDYNPKIRSLYLNDESETIETELCSFEGFIAAELLGSEYPSLPAYAKQNYDFINSVINDEMVQESKPDIICMVMDKENEDSALCCVIDGVASMLTEDDDGVKWLPLPALGISDKLIDLIETTLMN